jgi:UDPglucose 6-dehydrogenase
MNVTIVGYDMLAAAARHCCARHFNVTNEPSKDTEVLWVCYDTPVDRDFSPNVSSVVKCIGEDIEMVKPGTLVIVSSQLPVGTTKMLESEFSEMTFAHSPENIRVASPIADFERQARIIVGIRTTSHHAQIIKLLSPFTDNIVFTDPETAEFVKHALNGYLALSIAYINEVARLCEKTGADAVKVSDAMKMDVRISPKCPIRPGAPYGGGHLEREVWNLNNLAATAKLELPLISHIRASNELPR